MKNNAVLKNILPITFYLLLVIVVLFGILIRTKLYLAQFPFWLDEILLGYNFTDDSLSIFYSPLEADQKAPPLFSFVVMIIRKIAGLNELTLRFIPFLLGISSLFLFFRLLRANLNSRFGILVGMTLFSFCVPLVYFSAEFKPYGCDVFFCVLLLFLVDYIKFDNLNLKRTIFYSIATIFFVFMSFPTLFIIPAIIVSKYIEFKKFYLKTLFVWISFVLSGLYLYLYDVKNVSYLQNYWGRVEHGLTMSPSADFLIEFFIDYCQYSIYNFDAHYVWMVVSFVVIGFYVLYKHRKNFSFVLLLIFMFAIIASVIGVYPLKPKLSLYMVPIFVLLISKGFDLLENCGIYKILLNVVLSFCLLCAFGFNVPYLNISQSDMAYYNKSTKGRNKALDDREHVKEFSLYVLNNYQSSSKILASREFLYSLMYYKAYNNIDIVPNIITFDEIQNQYFGDFINENQNLWIIGRSNEHYFKSPQLDDVKEVLKGRKYQYFYHKDIYLFFVFS